MTLWPVIAVPLLVGVALLIWWTWRRPVWGLAVLMGGIAFHNLAVLLLVSVDTPALLVRVLQLWKEAVIAVLLVKVVVEIIQGARTGRAAGWLDSWKASSMGVKVTDLSVAAFSTLLVVYLFLPQPLFGPEAPSLGQRVIGFRLLALIPAFYVLGRYWAMKPPVGLAVMMGVTLAAAAAVGLLGFFELWFVPTSVWPSIGMADLSSLQGYAYGGPAGLPENFFQATSSGLLLRRMVSSYLSPLGIAYTGLLVVPMAVGMLDSPTFARVRRWVWVALVIVVAAIAMSLTRLAILCLVAEATALVVVLRRKEAVAVLGLVVSGALFGLLLYPSLGPIVDHQLTDIRPPAGAALVTAVIRQASDRPPGPGAGDGTVPPPTSDIIDQMVSGEDSSIRGHIRALVEGLPLVIRNPAGLGLGASTFRFGTGTGPEESAILGIAGELGVAGLIFALVSYGGSVLLAFACAWRQPSGTHVGLALLAAFGGAALLPVALTSAVWGDFSVTYLFWTAAGASVTAYAALPRRSRAVLSAVGSA